MKNLIIGKAQVLKKVFELNQFSKKQKKINWELISGEQKSIVLVLIFFSNVLEKTPIYCDRQYAIKIFFNVVCMVTARAHSPQHKGSIPLDDFFKFIQI